MNRLGFTAYSLRKYYLYFNCRIEITFFVLQKLHFYLFNNILIRSRQVFVQLVYFISHKAEAAMLKEKISTQVWKEKEILYNTDDLNFFAVPKHYRKLMKFPVFQVMKGILLWIILIRFSLTLDGQLEQKQQQTHLELNGGEQC